MHRLAPKSVCRDTTTRFGCKAGRQSASRRKESERGNRQQRHAAANTRQNRIREAEASRCRAERIRARVSGRRLQPAVLRIRSARTRRKGTRRAGDNETSNQEKEDYAEKAVEKVQKEYAKDLISDIKKIPRKDIHIESGVHYDRRVELVNLADGIAYSLFKRNINSGKKRNEPSFPRCAWLRAGSILAYGTFITF